MSKDLHEVYYHPSLIIGQNSALKFCQHLLLQQETCFLTMRSCLLERLGSLKAQFTL